MYILITDQNAREQPIGQNSLLLSPPMVAWPHPVRQSPVAVGTYGGYCYSFLGRQSREEGMLEFVKNSLSLFVYMDYQLMGWQCPHSGWI